MELEALEEAFPEIKEAGATLVVISPQRKEHLRQMAKKHHLTYDLIEDKGNAVAREFGLVFTLPDYLRELYLTFGIDLERFNGDDSWTLPIPARFVIDNNSVIRAVDADPDYTIRPEPGKTIEILKQIQR